VVLVGLVVQVRVAVSEGGVDLECFPVVGQGVGVPSLTLRSSAGSLTTGSSIRPRSATAASRPSRRCFAASAQAAEHNPATPPAAPPAALIKALPLTASTADAPAPAPVSVSAATNTTRPAAPRRRHARAISHP
jgi:hypothetical protein